MGIDYKANRGCGRRASGAALRIRIKEAAQ
jgi:hypothetical protein